MIPKQIKREHIIKAIELIDAKGYDKKNASTKYDLLHNRKKYPPKVIISLANIFVTGSPHPVDKFSGGDESNNFLIGLGFSIINKDGGIIVTSSKNYTLIQTEEDEENYTEGKEKFVTHKSYERNPLLSKKKKETVLGERSKLECEVCGFDFYKTYGDRGYGFIECHHNKPVSEMEGGRIVKMDDLSLLCSNCHRMIHRVRPWISVSELRKQMQHYNHFI